VQNSTFPHIPPSSGVSQDFGYIPPDQNKPPSSVVSLFPHTSDSYWHQKQVHINIKCDECGMNPLVGIRFKCNTCPDFDLCHGCFALKHLNAYGKNIHPHEFSIANKYEYIPPDQNKPTGGASPKVKQDKSKIPYMFDNSMKPWDKLPESKKKPSVQPPWYMDPISTEQQFFFAWNQMPAVRPLPLARWFGRKSKFKKGGELKKLVKRGAGVWPMFAFLYWWIPVAFWPLFLLYMVYSWLELVWYWLKNLFKIGKYLIASGLNAFKLEQQKFTGEIWEDGSGNKWKLNPITLKYELGPIRGTTYVWRAAGKPHWSVRAKLDNKQKDNMGGRPDREDLKNWGSMAFVQQLFLQQKGVMDNLMNLIDHLSHGYGYAAEMNRDNKWHVMWKNVRNLLKSVSEFSNQWEDDVLGELDGGQSLPGPGGKARRYNTNEEEEREEVGDFLDEKKNLADVQEKITFSLPKLIEDEVITEESANIFLEYIKSIDETSPDEVFSTVFNEAGKEDKRNLFLKCTKIQEFVTLIIDNIRSLFSHVEYNLENTQKQLINKGLVPISKLKK
jgi:hypothetical protein